LSRGARLALTAALLLALVACIMSSVVLTALSRSHARAAAGIDHVLAQLEALCAPNAPLLLVPIAHTIPFKGRVRLTEKLVIPVKDDIKMPKGLTVPFKAEVPIKAKVRVPLFPHGPAVDLPINTVVPIETHITLPERLPIPVDTRVALPAGLVLPIVADLAIDQHVPIEVCRPESPVKHAIETAIQQLRAVRGTVR
jgi:hypothetical protein